MPSKLRLFDRPLFADPLVLVVVAASAVIAGINMRGSLDWPTSSPTYTLLAYGFDVTIALVFYCFLFGFVAALIRRRMRKNAGHQDADRLNLSPGVSWLLNIGLAGSAYLIAFVVSVSLATGNPSGSAVTPAGGAGDSATMQGAGDAVVAQSCRDFMDGYVSMARDVTSQADAVNRLSRLRNTIKDPNITNQMQTMIFNVENGIQSGAPGINIVNYCLQQGAITEADVADWANQLKPYIRN